MRFRFQGLLLVVSCAVLTAGCEGGGSAGISAPAGAGAVPAAARQAAGVVPHGGPRRVQSIPSCSGLGTGAFVGGGYENVAAGAYSGVLEGNSNEVCDEESSIGGGYYNFVSSGQNTSYYSWIGSGYDNSISGNGYQSVLGGGNVNSITAPNSVLGGGNQNTLAGSDSVIAGGSNNQISSAGSYGAIGGGESNSVSALDSNVAGGSGNSVTSADSVIGGGKGNTVSNVDAVVSGGSRNVASGAQATVPGGRANTASGQSSFAAGDNSLAANSGAFVWSDLASGATQLASTANNQFLARASGGFTLWTNPANTVGATLAAGSGTWASASDRAMKTGVAAVDDAAMLNKVASLPITTWSYTSEHGVRHVGPMAQDFYAAFGVGEDNRHITSIDEDGVALAAIKALHAEHAALRGRLATVTSTQAQLAKKEALMERRIERLSTALSALTTKGASAP